VVTTQDVDSSAPQTGSTTSLTLTAGNCSDCSGTVEEGTMNTTDVLECSQPCVNDCIFAIIYDITDYQSFVQTAY
jgi:hypothetical protein